MLVMENEKVTISATKENVSAAIGKIKEYSAAKGYQIVGNIDEKKESIIDKAMQVFKGESPIKFDSKSQQKACQQYLYRLDKKMKMSTANKFLHLLFKKVYKLDKAPRVEYSEQELKIQNARKSWKKVQAEADKLLKEYKEFKTGFYTAK